MSQQYGASMGVVPVLAIQEALVVGLRVLREDEHAVEDVLGRSDLNTTEEWRRSLRRSLREVLDPNSDAFVEVRPSLPIPYGSARLPWVSVLEEGGGEDPSVLLMGNLLRDSFEEVGPDQELIRMREIGNGESTTVQIGIWDVSPERSQLLFAAVRWALLQQTQRLHERGVYGLSVRTGGVPVDPNLEPRVGYCPMLSVTMRWTLRQSHRRKVPNRVRRLAPTVST